MLLTFLIFGVGAFYKHGTKILSRIQFIHVHQKLDKKMQTDKPVHENGISVTYMTHCVYYAQCICNHMDDGGSDCL